MNINWRVRVRNKIWLTSLAAAVAAFIFDMAELFGFTPAVGQDTVMQAVSAVLTLLTALGVVIDPTTPGAGDSARAMGYAAKESA